MELSDLLKKFIFHKFSFLRIPLIFSGIITGIAQELGDQTISLALGFINCLSSNI